MVGNSAKLKIEIKADGKGASAAFKRLGRTAKDTMASMEKRLFTLNSAWLKAIAAIYALSKAWDMANVAAKAQQEEAAFRNMAASYGLAADKIIADLKKTSAQTIDTMTLIRKAGTAMMMGIQPDKLAELMAIARATSKMTGQTVGQAFSDLSLAVGRQSRMILDNLGIIVSMEKANKDYAQALGKTASKLTDVERKQAFLNATLKAGRELTARLGKQTRSTSEMFQSFSALISNLKVQIGKGLIVAIRWLVITFTQAGAIINQLFEKITQGWAYILTLLGHLPGGKLLGFQALGEYAQAAADHFRDAREEANRFTLELLKMGKAGSVTGRPPSLPAGPKTGPDKKAAAAAKAAAEERIRIHRHLTDEIKRLSLEEHEYKLWLIDEELEEIKKSAAYIKGNWEQRLALELRFEQVRALKKKQIQEERLAESERLRDREMNELKRSLDKIGEAGETFADRMKNAVQGWASDFSQTLTDLVWDAEVSFSQILESFGRMITEMIIQERIVGPLVKTGLTWLGSAQGNVFDQGRAKPFARGGLVDRPTLFPMARGLGLMGEAGPEAVMPLTRLPGGDLGVKAQPQGVRVEIFNQSGQPVRASRSEARFDAQEMIVTVWLDAYSRNAHGLRSALGT